MKARFPLLLTLVTVLAVACGGCETREEVKKRLDDAEVAWDRGENATAVEKYKGLYANRWINASEKARILPRIVEFELKASKIDDAKSWIKRGLDDKIEAEYADPTTKELLALVEREREEARVAKAAEEERKKREAEGRAEAARKDREASSARAAQDEQEKKEAAGSATTGRAANDAGGSEAGSDGVVYHYDSTSRSYYYRDSSGKTVHVNGYYRKDGTYVHSYNRAPPGAGRSPTKGGRKK